MFTKINEILKEKDSITIRISKSADYLAVSVLPDENSLQAFQLKGTGAELDQHFHEELGKALNVYTGFKSNLDELEKEAKAKLEEKKAKAISKSKPGKTENETEEEGEEEDDDNDKTVAKIEKPVKPKKIPKDVERLIGSYTKATDADMKMFCAKSIVKKLEELKWSHKEIALVLENNKIQLSTKTEESAGSTNPTPTPEVKHEEVVKPVPESKPEEVDTPVVDPDTIAVNTPSEETDDLPFSLGLEPEKDTDATMPDLNKNEEFQLGTSSITNEKDVLAEANFKAAIEETPVTSNPTTVNVPGFDNTGDIFDEELF